ncbi:MAG: Acidobacterial duplicated orphan permease [Cytophagales bacterium]|jgi:putative ABC transport system permease protein|nr:ABC transporter permease [Bacteroidota bacterium]MBS1981091.1 ABC transporter permease [Bacteroidota bacterium]WHZ08456.1 MAG: Acidobacterial duplicated orphan permease [Cytophagales bacterium]
MLRNHLKITFRNLLRYKSFSVINIAGLTIGLVTVLAISLYVVDELSFDRFHEKVERIYRIVIKADYDGKSHQWSQVPNKVAPTVANEIPEVEKAVRVFHHNFGDIAFVSTETEKFAEKELYFADPAIFDVFSISLLEGDAQKALARKGTVILSETTARKYFGDKSPVGKTISVDNQITLEVTGVYKDFPANSSLTGQIIGSFSSINFGKDENQSWGNASFETFLLLKDKTTPQAVNQKIAAMLERNIPKEDRWFSLSLQPMADIHLHSDMLESSFDRKVYGDFNQIKILIVLALAVLVIAAVNYVNLTTAQSQRRNKEVGVSKTLGATFGQMSFKFFFEASFVVLISLIFSVIVFYSLLPSINSLIGKNISAAYLFTPYFIASFAVVWVLLTLLSGFYPAFYLSSFSPKAVIQKAAASRSQSAMRKGLVVFQFSISVILICSTLIFYQQMSYISQKKLGYKPEQVLAVMVSAAKDKLQVPSLKKEFEALPEVKKVSISQSYPGIGTSGYTLTPEGSSTGTFISATRSSYEILDVLGIKLLAGKTLPEFKDPKDTTVQVVLNKAAVDYLQLTPDEAIGKRVKIFYNQPTEVIGVTEDFHFGSLHQKIAPYCFDNSRDNSMGYLLLRLDTKDIRSSLIKLEGVYRKIIPSAFEYTFIDEQMAQLHAADKQLTRVVSFFAALAIFVACLGLYALASFTAEQKTKEIGIRKVMGASATQLVNMLSKEFLILVLIAFIIGIPASYYFMNRWLESFAYRTEIGVGVFALAGLLSLVVAWLTVSIESFKAAHADPVKSLRSE